MLFRSAVPIPWAGLRRQGPRANGLGASVGSELTLRSTRKLTPVSNTGCPGLEQASEGRVLEDGRRGGQGMGANATGGTRPRPLDAVVVGVRRAGKRRSMRRPCGLIKGEVCQRSSVVSRSCACRSAYRPKGDPSVARNSARCKYKRAQLSQHRLRSLQPTLEFRMPCLQHRNLVLPAKVEPSATDHVHDTPLDSHGHAPDLELHIPADELSPLALHPRQDLAALLLAPLALAVDLFDDLAHVLALGIDLLDRVLE